MDPYRIIIADDHSLIRRGFKSIIRQDISMQVIAEAGNGRELLALLPENNPDLVILDITMPEMNGIEVVGHLREHYPQIKSLMLTMHCSNRHLYHAISEGAHGYLLKDESDVELLNAIRTIRSGRIYVSPQLSPDITNEMLTSFREQRPLPLATLTGRERQVLQLVVKGHTSKEMGEILCLSPRTVDHHRGNLLKKFNMRGTVDLVKYAVRNALVPQE